MSTVEMTSIVAQAISPGKDILCLTAGSAGCGGVRALLAAGGGKLGKRTCFYFLVSPLPFTITIVFSVFLFTLVLLNKLRCHAHF